MRLSGSLLAAVLGLLSSSAFAQISYVSRDSFIGYFEEDLDLLTSQQTFSASDAVGTSTFNDFNQFLVYPTTGTAWSDTSVGQFSRLFADAIEFDTRALAEEDRTDNAFGLYTAGARSTFNVVFDINQTLPFSLTGDVFNASASNKPGTTRLSFTGPSVSIDVSDGPLNFNGALDPGRYTLDIFVESLGSYEDGFLGINRVRGEDLGLDALLLFGIIDTIAGDYNNSGQVEQGDLDLVLQNWGVDTAVAGVPAGWTGPQPSGQIEQTELDGVLQNWGNTTAPNFLGSAVPEPASALVLLGLTAACRRRP